MNKSLRKRDAAPPAARQTSHVRGPACALAALLAVVALHVFAETTSGPSVLDDVRTDARVAVVTVAIGQPWPIRRNHDDAVLKGVKQTKLTIPPVARRDVVRRVEDTCVLALGLPVEHQAAPVPPDASAAPPREDSRIALSPQRPRDPTPVWKSDSRRPTPSSRPT